MLLQVWVCIPTLFSLYNVTSILYFFFFRIDHLLLSDQLVCSSLRKLITVS